MIKLAVEPQELDFIAQRLTAGQMDFQTAMNVKNLLDKLVGQANNADFQAPPKQEEKPDATA